MVLHLRDSGFEGNLSIHKSGASLKYPPTITATEGYLLFKSKILEERS